MPNPELGHELLNIYQQLPNFDYPLLERMDYDEEHFLFVLERIEKNDVRYKKICLPVFFLVKHREKISKAFADNKNITHIELHVGNDLALMSNTVDIFFAACNIPSLQYIGAVFESDYPLFLGERIKMNAPINHDKDDLRNVKSLYKNHCHTNSLKNFLNGFKRAAKIVNNNNRNISLGIHFKQFTQIMPCETFSFNNYPDDEIITLLEAAINDNCLKSISFSGIIFRETNHDQIRFYKDDIQLYGKLIDTIMQHANLEILEFDRFDNQHDYLIKQFKEKEFKKVRYTPRQGYCEINGRILWSSKLHETNKYTSILLSGSKISNYVVIEASIWDSLEELDISSTIVNSNVTLDSCAEAIMSSNLKVLNLSAHKEAQVVFLQSAEKNHPKLKFLLSLCRRGKGDEFVTLIKPYYRVFTDDFIEQLIKILQDSTTRFIIDLSYSIISPEALKKLLELVKKISNIAIFWYSQSESNGIKNLFYKSPIETALNTHSKDNLAYWTLKSLMPHIQRRAIHCDREEKISLFAHYYHKICELRCDETAIIELTIEITQIISDCYTFADTEEFKSIWETLNPYINKYPKAAKLFAEILINSESRDLNHCFMHPKDPHKYILLLIFYSCDYDNELFAKFIPIYLQTLRGRDVDYHETLETIFKCGKVQLLPYKKLYEEIPKHERNRLSLDYSRSSLFRLLEKIQVRDFLRKNFPDTKIIIFEDMICYPKECDLEPSKRSTLLTGNMNNNNAELSINEMFNTFVNIMNNRFGEENRNKINEEEGGLEMQELSQSMMLN